MTGAPTPRRDAHRDPRGGFALLAVLWVLVGLSALGLAIALTGQAGIRAAANRASLTRARWIAEACVARSRAAIAEALRAEALRAEALPAEALRAPRESSGGPRSAWRALDRQLGLDPLAPNALGPGASGAGEPCAVTLRPIGLTLDINGADAAMLHALFAHLYIPEPSADSLSDALQDWRDADDVARPRGAERAAYTRAGRMPPRNGPLADVRELVQVRGYEALPGLDSLFGVDAGRLLLDRAPLVVLGALPGLGDEALARLAELRARNVSVTDLIALAGQLSPPARRVLLARYAELSRLTTAEPDGWILTARAETGLPPVTAVLAVRLVRAGDRAVIVRRREWVE